MDGIERWNAFCVGFYIGSLAGVLAVVILAVLLHSFAGGCS